MQSTTKQVKPPVQVDKSPLINLEDVEDELINTNSALKIPKKFNFIKDTPKSLKVPSSLMTVINEESDSSDTFEENEMNCMNSPSVFKNINVTNNISHIKDVAEMIKNVIKKEEEAFTNYVDIHKDNMVQLRSLLNLFGSKTGEDNGRKFVKTPNSTEDNLRKKVLKKNLVSELYQSPRTRNALSLYNSLRSTNSVLETPKLDRCVRQESPGQYLSDALMQQCILLQTPVHKK